MGIPTPRPPLPPTATKAEMIADLRRIQREIVEYRIMTLIVMGVGVVAAVCMIIMATWLASPT